MRFPDLSYEASCVEVKTKLEEGLLYVILSELCLLARYFGDLGLDLLLRVEVPGG